MDTNQYLSEGQSLFNQITREEKRKTKVWQNFNNYLNLPENNYKILTPHFVDLEDW